MKRAKKLTICKAIRAVVVLIALLGAGSVAQAANFLYVSGHILDGARLTTFGGHTLTTTFTGNDANWATALTGGFGPFDAIVVGENGSFFAGLYSAATNASIAAYVSGGGRIIVMGGHTAETTFLNNIYWI